MKSLLSLLIVLALALILAACGASPTPVATESPVLPQPDVQDASPDLTRSDAQGAVTLSVTPVNLSNPGDELVFDVVMDTHSLDLTMDLAALATLTTDQGHTVQATLWDAPSGGHHVEGQLSFPSSVDGKLLLDGATELTLTIKDVDVPLRVFTWGIQK